MNWILIGMPGAGKSTIGVVLAKTLGVPFIDTDLIIQERESMRLQDYINTKGLERFLEAEEQAVLSVKNEKSVVATGGSVVYKDKAMQHLKSIGKIIYLELPYRIIRKRIRNISTRGIAMGENQTLLDVYTERQALYEKYADIIVQCKGKNMEQIIEEIITVTGEK